MKPIKPETVYTMLSAFVICGLLALIVGGEEWNHVRIWISHLISMVGV